MLENYFLTKDVDAQLFVRMTEKILLPTQLINIEIIKMDTKTTIYDISILFNPPHTGKEYFQLEPRDGEDMEWIVNRNWRTS